MDFFKNLCKPKQPDTQQTALNEHRLWGPWTVVMENVQDRTQDGEGGAIQLINYDDGMFAYISALSNPKDNTPKTVKFDKPKKDAKGNWNLGATVRHPGYVFVFMLTYEKASQLAEAKAIVNSLRKS